MSDDTLYNIASGRLAAEGFPDDTIIEPVHGHGLESACVLINGGNYVVVTTSDETEGVYLLGLYQPSAWENGKGEVIYAECADQTTALDAIVYLATGRPDTEPASGVFRPWARDWIHANLTDAFDDSV